MCKYKFSFHSGEEDVLTWDQRFHVGGFRTMEAVWEKGSRYSQGFSMAHCPTDHTTIAVDLGATVWQGSFSYG